MTEALCELPCLADPSERGLFAEVLSDLMDIHIDLRMVKQRQDVIAMVRAVSRAPAGERVLVDVVGIFEGGRAAAEFAELLAPDDLTGPLLGPLTQHDVNYARSLLDAVEGELSGARLRDRLATELHHDPPAGLAPGQLFGYLVELNVQPDGLPPAVLLMDHAAELIQTRSRQRAVAEWAESWVERAGLRPEFELRRADRARATADPTIPRCLVVAVEPAEDGSGEIVVRPWLNTVPGYWHPRPADPETTSLDGLAAVVERALRQVLRRSAAFREPLSELGPATPYIEFVLPYDLLNHDVAGLTVRSGDGEPLPLSLKYGVHLRSLERMRTDDVLVRAQWHERWAALQKHGITVHGWRASTARGAGEWQTVLAGEPGHTALVLDAPDGGTAAAAFRAAVAEGFGLAVWDRRGEFKEERREVVTGIFAGVRRHPAHLPHAIHELRRAAELDAAASELLGRHIAFFWDDPTRPVDIQPRADYDLEHGPRAGRPDEAGTIDSEETPV
ncbi:hypothetical protein AB0D34_07070 [Streptomyces sp. NPDC048420]|uniref:VMAP-C domain-containing protein n=1 Tax=Streptomyces sp. NPDC048420 TaxID=3155755 RepID=UPI00344144DF